MKSGDFWATSFAFVIFGGVIGMIIGAYTGSWDYAIAHHWPLTASYETENFRDTTWLLIFIVGMIFSILLCIAVVKQTLEENGTDTGVIFELVYLALIFSIIGFLGGFYLLPVINPPHTPIGGRYPI
mgnify:CR=1 FL=1